jgi:hypothetical protein
LRQLFHARHFPSYLQNDLDRPKGIQKIEKHAKGKRDVLKVPGETGLTRRVVGIVMRRRVNTVPKVGTDKQSGRKKSQDEESHVDGQRFFGKEFGADEIQVDGGELNNFAFGDHNHGERAEILLQETKSFSFCLFRTGTNFFLTSIKSIGTMISATS